MNKELTKSLGVPQLIFKEKQISYHTSLRVFYKWEKLWMSVRGKLFINTFYVYFSHRSLCYLRSNDDYSKLFYSKSELSTEW